ncbi:D-lactate dehydrogenase (cytochrome) [Fibrella aestuarina BUZ 2]|uniref:D-lactate dehydrogenase (Cytochrome) n=1 Tax=Fibrella aestuarina BUZ 2 TaxID=1166018 RepID=I0K513_9BACT|nr:FAD-binding and (Fe-S)-binding domain-containing protein [Fibrella aestuarina]CCG99216.1 D-lactate dehydrogenase (cytochrome) [Fibrella aestuarina BUZ 2]
MIAAAPQLPFAALQPSFEGELYFDTSTEHVAQRMLYATDASVYQETPLAVAIPRTVDDIKRLVRFAKANKSAGVQASLIPRAAGTSLAGQVVGSGIVVDISTHFNQILEINPAERWVRVQPGVIRDDLNVALRPHGLQFGPETSTASRAMIGGMIGNNSCGLHSIVWGTTRDHLLEVRAVLADGAEVTFGHLSADDFAAKCRGEHVVSPLEQRIYQQFQTWLSDPQLCQQIRDGYPNANVTRRNTGYALDALVEQGSGRGAGGGEQASTAALSPQAPSPKPPAAINLAALIAGSEGTLCFITEAKLNLLPLPPAHVALVCAHFQTLRQSLEANLVALAHHCWASELVDDYILQLTKTNAEQLRNRTFVEEHPETGDPKAVLMVEFFDDTEAGVRAKAEAFVASLQAAGLGYAYPILHGDETKKPWALRKAGLSIMYNIPGDEKPANVIEDCAVAPQDLPDYIDELTRMAKENHGLDLEYSAHAGAGELHVLPLINLKTTPGRETFRALLMDTATLVKKYGGALSGEHGDGRLRGEFIAFMLGPENYELCKAVKALWDPDNLFNPGKVVDTPPMNEHLRYVADAVIPQPQTRFDFSKDGGLLELAEKCSGSGDCRKTHLSGGTMCPSYMATRREHDTTRARANMLRHYFTGGDGQTVTMDEVKDVLDLCLSCKACQTECPSSVDMTRMKAEFTQRLYDERSVPLRARLVGNFSRLMGLASLAPWAYNAIYDTPALRRIANRLVGFHPDRTMPALKPVNAQRLTATTSKAGAMSKTVNLFLDEFTRYNDGYVAEKTAKLLDRLGYKLVIPDHAESGRTYLSKGLVDDARKLAIRNVTYLRDHVTADAPLIGLEPSAILTFRDEYPDLVPAELKADARRIAQHTYLFEEWIAREADAGRITPEAFTTEARTVNVHGHCHQKALSGMTAPTRALSLPQHYTVEVIPSGCCGMAGSFGYETEHYDLSMQIGELVLFPAVRAAASEVIVAAPGTSCRHQIKDGTGRKALHPAEVLFEALRQP